MAAHDKPIFHDTVHQHLIKDGIIDAIRLVSGAPPGLLTTVLVAVSFVYKALSSFVHPDRVRFTTNNCYVKDLSRDMAGRQ